MRMIDLLCEAIGVALDEREFNWNACLTKLGFEVREHKTDDEEETLPLPPEGFTVLFDWADHDGWHGVIWIRPTSAIANVLLQPVKQ